MGAEEGMALYATHSNGRIAREEVGNGVVRNMTTSLLMLVVQASYLDFGLQTRAARRIRWQPSQFPVQRFGKEARDQEPERDARGQHDGIHRNDRSAGSFA